MRKTKSMEKMEELRDTLKRIYQSSEEDRERFDVKYQINEQEVIIIDKIVKKVTIYTYTRYRLEKYKKEDADLVIRKTLVKPKGQNTYKIIMTREDYERTKEK